MTKRRARRHHRILTPAEKQRGKRAAERMGTTQKAFEATPRGRVLTHRMETEIRKRGENPGYWRAHQAYGVAYDKFVKARRAAYHKRTAGHRKSR